MRTIKPFVNSILIVAAILATGVGFAQDREVGGVGITVFANENFHGKTATFRQDIPDLTRFGFNDVISSLKVAPGEKWEICEHINYQGRCLVVSGNESDLKKHSWSDVVSSMRIVGGVGGAMPGVPSESDPYIVLFDQTTYRGNPVNYNGPTASLFGNNGRTQSVTIGRGTWELCEGMNFTGRCITLNRSVPDLRTYNMENRIYSVRPVGTAASTPPQTNAYIVLFDQPGYRGHPKHYKGQEPNLNRRVQSVTIGSGVWELCEERNFAGRCITLDRSVPDLDAYDMRDHVSSVRPVTRQPR